MTIIASTKEFAVIFQHRHNIIPFEGGFALFAIYSSLVGLIQFGIVPSAVSRELGSIFNTLTQAAFLLAGLGLYFGIGLNRRDIEIFGLIFTIGCLLSRVVAISWVVGFSATTLNNYIYNAIFLIVCLIRLDTLFKRHIIIRLNETPPVHPHAYEIDIVSTTNFNSNK